MRIARNKKFADRESIPKPDLRELGLALRAPQAVNLGSPTSLSNATQLENLSASSSVLDVKRNTERAGTAVSTLVSMVKDGLVTTAARRDEASRIGEALDDSTSGSARVEAATNASPTRSLTDTTGGNPVNTSQSRVDVQQAQSHHGVTVRNAATRPESVIATDKPDGDAAMNDAYAASSRASTISSSESEDQDTTNTKQTSQMASVALLTHEVGEDLLSHMPTRFNDFEFHDMNHWNRDYKPVRLLVGRYVFEEDNELCHLWAYMKQAGTANAAPAIELVVGGPVRSRPGETHSSKTQRARDRGRKDWTKVSSAKTDGRAEWFPYFAVPQNDAELKALVKCAYIVAAESPGCPLEEYSIPLKESFVTQVRNVCNRFKDAGVYYPPTAGVPPISSKLPRTSHGRQTIISRTAIEETERTDVRDMSDVDPEMLQRIEGVSIDSGGYARTVFNTSTNSIASDAVSEREISVSDLESTSEDWAGQFMRRSRL